MLELTGPLVISRNFWLLDLKSGTANLMEAVWRAHPRAGAKILLRYDLKTSKRPDLQHLRELWTAERCLSGQI